MAGAEVLALAIRGQRVCVTFDKDFGELAATGALPAECGVLLLRIRPPASVESSAGIAATLTARNDWVGCFSVLEPGCVRMRPLPRR